MTDHPAALLAGPAHVIVWANEAMLATSLVPMLGLPTIEAFTEARHKPIHEFVDLCYRHQIAGQIATWSPRIQSWGLLTVTPVPSGLRLDWVPTLTPQRPGPGPAEGAEDRTSDRRLVAAGRDHE